MPRKNLLKTDNLPYHITARTNNKETFPLSLEQSWKVLANECYLITAVYGAEIHAFTMIPNHFHMLVTIPVSDLGHVMNCFMSDVTRTFNLISGRTGHLFGGPYHWSVINSDLYYAHALKYVYRNPVRAKLVERVEDFPFSTFYGRSGNGHLPFPLFSSRSLGAAGLIPEDLSAQTRWLNRPFPNEALEAIRKGLRYREFKIHVDRKNRQRLNIFENLI